MTKSSALRINECALLECKKRVREAKHRHEPYCAVITDAAADPEWIIARIKSRITGAKHFSTCRYIVFTFHVRLGRDDV